MHKKILLLVISLLSSPASANINPINGIAFVNMNIVKQECIWCNKKSEQLEASLKNIEIQSKLFQEQLSELERNSEEYKELVFRIERLDIMAEGLYNMHDVLIETKIEMAIREIIEAEGFSAAMNMDSVIFIHPLFDITYKVINKINMKYINKEKNEFC